MVIGVAALLGFCVVLCLGFGWYLSRHSTRADAFVTLLNLAGDCKVRIPPAPEKHPMLCTELPDYLQKRAHLPLRSAFIVFVRCALLVGISSELPSLGHLDSRVLSVSPKIQVGDGSPSSRLPAVSFAAARTAASGSTRAKTSR